MLVGPNVAFRKLSRQELATLEGLGFTCCRSLSPRLPKFLSSQRSPSPRIWPTKGLSASRRSVGKFMIAHRSLRGAIAAIDQSANHVPGGQEGHVTIILPPAVSTRPSSAAAYGRAA